MNRSQLLQPGQNCWRIMQANRATVIVDAEDYFRTARATMLEATQQILLIGWDFDARIRFKDDRCDDDGPEKVGAFISWLTERTPGLNIYILRWDTGALKTLFHARTLFRIARWTRDEQVHLRLDARHPIGGSHHQKVLVIDDAIAFCGGIDMTADRWDTREHRDDDPRRVQPNGRHYGPWHDATTMLQGPVAQALGEMCRDRWRISGGEIQAPHDVREERWPDHVASDFNDVNVAIARTIPEMEHAPGIREIESLYVDLIRSAKRWIYAESQYFASRKVAEAIGARLAEVDGPEIVIVHPETADGWLEPLAMDTARARIFEALKAQDEHDRLRLYHPFTAAGEPIYVHAKVMVIDDDVIRVGSSNFNNRSMRLDTECDVVIDRSTQPADAKLGKIAGIRNALLAEHLGTDCMTIETRLTKTGSIIATIEQLRTSGRSLRPYQVPDQGAVKAWLADNKILDPEGPEEMFEGLKARIPLVQKLKRHRSLRTADGRIDKVAVSVGALGIAAIAGAALIFVRNRQSNS